MLVHINVEQAQNPYLRDFLNSFQERKLRYYASELRKVLALPALSYLDDALQRAMKVCRSQQLELEEHFKPVYRCEETGVVKDWKLSPLAWCLVILNADPASPEVARMQLALLKNSFDQDL